jgi:rhodanese-related sulfurtransferase
MAEDIRVQELKSKMDAKEELVLLDVRESNERAEFNIGGEFIPIGSLMGRMEELEQHKEDEIVVYCRSGNRSGLAKEFMEKAGFKNVRNLLGGMMSWADQYGTEK